MTPDDLADRIGAVLAQWGLDAADTDVGLRPVAQRPGWWATSVALRLAGRREGTTARGLAEALASRLAGTEGVHEARASGARFVEVSLGPVPALPARAVRTRPLGAREDAVRRRWVAVRASWELPRLAGRAVQTGEAEPLAVLLEEAARAGLDADALPGDEAAVVLAVLDAGLRLLGTATPDRV